MQCIDYWYKILIRLFIYYWIILYFIKFLNTNFKTSYVFDCIQMIEKLKYKNYQLYKWRGLKCQNLVYVICEISLNNVYPKKFLHVKNSAQIWLHVSSLYMKILMILNCIKVKKLQFLSMLIQQSLGRGGQKCRPHLFKFKTTARFM